MLLWHRGSFWATLLLLHSAPAPNSVKHLIYVQQNKGHVAVVCLQSVLIVIIIPGQGGVNCITALGYMQFLSISNQDLDISLPCLRRHYAKCIVPPSLRLEGVRTSIIREEAENRTVARLQREISTSTFSPDCQYQSCFICLPVQSEDLKTSKEVIQQLLN